MALRNDNVQTFDTERDEHVHRDEKKHPDEEILENLYFTQPKELRQIEKDGDLKID